ncbi:UDP-N-acetylmuramoyl-tripeptide--D-alanyl-D-alanine ligase [Burkholderiales bacterium]|nr:UDP-N-acetylmuramoyl-tripeptide--D-alanyl-D-alanine ligase [Burkholderiales bacterium]
MFKIAECATDTKMELIGDPSLTVSRISTDSRDINKGDLYVALKGPNFDGHDFVPEAFEQGAVACMVSEDYDSSSEGKGKTYLKTFDTHRGLTDLSFWWRRKFRPRLKVIGITGSNGKTTVKEMIANILRCEIGLDLVLATKGNLNNDIGVPKTLLELTVNHEYAVVEMGMSNLGELRDLAHLVCPDLAVITNIGTAHIGELGSQDAIAEAKSEIISGLSKDGVLVVEADGNYSEYLISKYSEGAVLKFGKSNEADISGEYVDSVTLPTLKITDHASIIDVDLKIRGDHNILNALAAAAVCFSLKISASSIKQGLESFESVEGRLESIKLRSGDVLINDSYNANFDSVCRALEYLAVEPGKKIFVFGDMGELGKFGPPLHEKVGEYAKSKGIDLLLGFGALTKKAVASFGANAIHFESASELLGELKAHLNGQTYILVKGSRFMKMEYFCSALIAL